MYNRIKKSDELSQTANYDNEEFSTSKFIRTRYEYLARKCRFNEMTLQNRCISSTDISKLPNLAESEKVFRYRPTDNPSSSFVALQEWEGYVTSINEDKFVADLIDTTNDACFSNEQTEFSQEELSYEQRLDLRIGSVFRWSIGYEKSPSGNRRTSQLVFRQLPKWSQSDINDSKRYGEYLSNRIRKE